MRRFLILTADDFGLHESVNEAVERASCEGVLNAASLMVNERAAADAVRRARALPHLRVGLHLVLVDGWPALEPALASALTDETGRFANRVVLDGIRYFLSPKLRRVLEAEIRAQFEAFRRTGLALDHVNAHKHFHLHPTLLDMMISIGLEFGVRAVRVPDEPFVPLAGRRQWSARMTNAILVAPWAARMKQKLRTKNIVFNDHILGLSSTGSMDEAGLLCMLARIPDGVTEIYFHPATMSGAAIAPSMAGYRHSDEFDALMSPRVRATLRAMAVPSGGYLDLIRSRE